MDHKKYKKYHLLTGFISLVITIILPTIIVNYFSLLKTLCESLFDYSFYQIIGNACLVLLILIWMATLIIALRELGGYILQLGDYDYRRNIYE